MDSTVLPIQISTLYNMAQSQSTLLLGAIEMDSETSIKKPKRKKIRNLPATNKEDNKGIVRKQRELMRVLHVKNFQLQNGKLSYLDYLELKEELLRLNALKDVFNTMSCTTE